MDVNELDIIRLGRQGENDVTAVEIDCSGWLTELPGATLSVVATRPGERTLYVPTVTQSAGVVTWRALAQDTQNAGNGQAEVRATVNGKIKKSKIFRTQVERALDGPTGAPAALPDWVQAVTDAAADAAAAAQAAQEAAQATEQVALDAAVRHDITQVLDDGDRARARSNIGALGAEIGASNVLFSCASASVSGRDVPLILPLYEYKGPFTAGQKITLTAESQVYAQDASSCMGLLLKAGDTQLRQVLGGLSGVTAEITAADISGGLTAVVAVYEPAQTAAISRTATVRGVRVILGETAAFDGTALLGDYIGRETAGLKAAVDEMHGNLVRNGYTTKAGIYINPSTSKFAASANTSVLVLPISGNTTYKIWKATASTMRVGVGSVADPAAGDRITSVANHTQASGDPLVITSGAADRYLYVQLYVNADPEAVRSNEANLKTLIVCEYDDGGDTVQEVIDAVHGIEVFCVDSNGYIATGDAATTVNTDAPEYSPNLKYAVVTCQPGDVFTLNGTGGATARLWCFVGQNGENIRHAGQNVTGEDLEIVAPSGAVKLVVNMNVSNIGVCYKGRLMTRPGICELNADMDPLIQSMGRKVLTTNATEDTAYQEAPAPLRLAHLSDTHSDAGAVARFTEWCRAHSGMIDEMILTGDLVDNKSQPMDFFNYAADHEHILLVLGNHDQATGGAGQTGDNSLSESDAYDKYMAPYIAGWNVNYASGQTYWYKDYAASKIRLIGMNTNYRGRTGATADEQAAEDAEYSWLTAALDGAKAAGYAVVIAQHYPLGGTAVSCNFHMPDKDLANSAKPNVYSRWVQAVDAFIAGGGEFVCWLAGHSHADLVTVGGANNAQLCFTVTTQSSAANINICADAERAVGTRSEDAFNVIAIDQGAKLVKLARIGANTDLYLRGRNALVMNYQTKEILLQR